jgi:hypothetical protein
VAEKVNAAVGLLKLKWFNNLNLREFPKAATFVDDPCKSTAPGLDPAVVICYSIQLVPIGHCKYSLAYHKQGQY